MLNLAQAIGMSPETYDSNWPLFYKLYLAMSNNEGEIKNYGTAYAFV